MAVTVTFNSRPPILHKFWSMPKRDSDEEKYLRNLLIDHKLYFQMAHELNDPFDCFPAIFTNLSPERACAAFERQIRREMPGINDAECAAEAERLVKQFDFGCVKTPEFQLDARDAFKDLRKSLAVYCLSARTDSVLMWSHYSKNHTGFVVMFDIGSEVIREAQSVEYLRDRPLIDPGARSERDMYAVLLTKARDWRYEQEWRITRVARPGLHDFDPRAIKGIVFGMKMPEVDRERLSEMCREGGLCCCPLNA